MVKVSELSGVALDWAVAKCEGKNGILHDDGITRCIVIASIYGVYKGTWKPSTDPALSQPIMEREKIDCIADPNGKDVWMGQLYATRLAGNKVIRAYGPTMLIAAMRCYVASKFGEEIEIPKELL